MNVLPNEDESLLIRAAMGDGAVALDAWRRWRARVDFDALEEEPRRIVPLLYRNLARLGVPAAELTRYASVYRQCWATNEIAFRVSAQAIARLHDAGIKTLILKGGALAVLHYGDVGVRSMGDVDVLVPRERAMDAVDVLSAHGWERWPRGAKAIDEALLATVHSAGFQDAKGRQVDLHWYATSEAKWQGVDDALWGAAVPIVFSGISTLALAPTDLLYNVLSHGYSSFAAHIRWVADAVVIIRGGGVDWQRFVALASDRRFVLPALQQLRWLAEHLGVAVPAATLDALAAVKVSRLDQLEHAHANAADPYTLDKVMLRYWCWYRRTSAQRGLRLALGFPRYLARHYKVDDVAQLARIVGARGLERWRRLIGERSGT